MKQTLTELKGEINGNPREIAIRKLEYSTFSNVYTIETEDHKWNRGFEHYRPVWLNTQNTPPNNSKIYILLKGTCHKTIYWTEKIFFKSYLIKDFHLEYKNPYSSIIKKINLIKNSQCVWIDISLKIICK